MLQVAHPIPPSITVTTVNDGGILNPDDITATMNVANESFKFQACRAQHVGGHNITKMKGGHQDMHKFVIEKLICV